MDVSGHQFIYLPLYVFINVFIPNLYDRYVQLILEQEEFKLCGSTYMQIFKNECIFLWFS